MKETKQKHGLAAAKAVRLKRQLRGRSSAPLTGPLFPSFASVEPGCARQVEILELEDKGEG
jgi:hypothetical protein